MRARLRAVAPMAVAAVLALPAAASAGPLAPLGSIVGTYQDAGSRSFSTLGGTVQAFQMYAVDITGQQNAQTVQGAFGGAVFAGFLTSHTYDHASDHPTWTLSGTVDPAGANPPVPLNTTLVGTYDRERETNTFTLSGTVAGIPITGQGTSIDLPTTYQLVP
jgi:hypothetical protein